MTHLLKIAAKDPQEFLALIVRNADEINWEVQGFGMLRCYLTSKEIRLHIWDKRLRVHNVSTIHNHPWDFTSVILKGSLDNVLFKDEGEIEPTHEQAVIHCGMDAHITSEISKRRLSVMARNTYTIGQSYSEQASELHESLPEDGSITLIERHPKTNPDLAKVFWPLGTKWVDATPRNATPEEVNMVINSICL